MAEGVRRITARGSGPGRGARFPGGAESSARMTFVAQSDASDHEARELLRRAEAWCRSDPDPGTIEELRGLVARGDVSELAERFSGPLTFGTAGLRGILGAGPSRMNRAVVRLATAGLARYLLRVVPEARTRGVVVGHDARREGALLAQETAGVLAGHGITVHLLPPLAPTPLLAFAVPHHVEGYARPGRGPSPRPG